jgi:hypothetical protein
MVNLSCTSGSEHVYEHPLLMQEMSMFCDSVTQSSNSQSSYARFVAKWNMIGALYQISSEIVGCQAQLKT